MDRHRAPAMTRDSICFGVYVDGVCAVGCDRPNVLAAMKAVKATLNAAGLQCSVIEADYIQASFHRTSVGSRRLAISGGCNTGLEFAACHKQLTGDQVAKLIGLTT